MLCDRCVDCSLMIRKQCSKSLTELVLKYPHKEEIIEAWFQGVFPLLGDSDIKSQEKVVEVFINVTAANF